MKLKIFFTLTFLYLACMVTAQKYCAPVEKLKSLYENDKSFRKTVDLMFDNLQNLPDGTENPWKDKQITDLYQFMNDWYYFIPNTHNGLDRIIEFSLLYYKNPYGKKFILEEPGKSWSLHFVEERGKYMDSPESTKGIQKWLADPKLNNEEYVLPSGGFQSFNDFFTRELKPGSRSVDAVGDNSVLASPADGVINMINNDLQLDSEIPTKANMTMSLKALLGNSSYAEKFVGGTAVAVFLMPDNYHHYHSPTTGKILESRQNVGDRLFGMPDVLDMVNKGNPGYNKDYSVFQDFKHGYFIIETSAYGLIGMIPIGLHTIGSVVFEEDVRNVDTENPVDVYKGQKLGHFAYGGSTVLLIFEKGRFNAVSVQQGQQIGKLR